MWNNTALTCSFNRPHHTYHEADSQLSTLVTQPKTKNSAKLSFVEKQRRKVKIKRRKEKKREENGKNIWGILF